MKFFTKSALLALPALALATRRMRLLPRGLADITQPGSVIIFPKFINQGSVIVDGNTVSRTEIEIGAVCPPLAAFARNQVGCTEHAPVKVRFHWVCPGFEGFDSNICRESDFEVVLSINGKLAFSADGIQINSNSPIVPTPRCQRGYLIGWVIRATDDAPIKYDALIGNAVIRGPNVASSGSSTAVSAYSAITIQANDADAVGAVLGSPNSSAPANLYRGECPRHLQDDHRGAIRRCQVRQDGGRFTWPERAERDLVDVSDPRCALEPAQQPGLGRPRLLERKLCRGVVDQPEF